MYNSSFNEDGYSYTYLVSRKQVDKLCDLVVRGAISFKKALDEYDHVESNFSSREPEMAELFKMIYRNRVERLSSQFRPEKN